MPKTEFDFFGGLLGDTMKKVKARKKKVKKRLESKAGKKRKGKKNG